MRIPVETYKIVCDGCGETFRSEEGFVCYCDNPNSIEDDADCSGWVMTSDGHHYCNKCHEWNDEDILECKDGRRYDEDYEPIGNEVSLIQTNNRK